MRRHVRHAVYLRMWCRSESGDGGMRGCRCKCKCSVGCSKGCASIYVAGITTQAVRRERTKEKLGRRTGRSRSQTKADPAKRSIARATTPQKRQAPQPERKIQRKILDKSPNKAHAPSEHSTGAPCPAAPALYTPPRPGGARWRLSLHDPPAPAYDLHWRAWCRCWGAKDGLAPCARGSREGEKWNDKGQACWRHGEAEREGKET